MGRFLAILLLLVGPAAYAATDPSWLAPIPGFRIADNLYYVGSKDLASYLITTPQGDILINSSLEASVPLIRRSIEGLGVKMTDVKILLISHAHSDHAAGSAALLKLTHAQYMVMDGDVPVVESGGAKDFLFPNSRYPAAHVDRVLHDGDEVRLGGAVLTAHKTPGHTKGNTTWTMQTTDQGRTLNAVIVGSWSINGGTNLINDPLYPQIAADYAHSFAVWKSLPCDLFLGAHGSYFHMVQKREEITQDGPNPFVDPDAYKAAVAANEKGFYKELKRQQSGGR